MKISERIKNYRKENNLTQKEFADKLYVSKQAVSKWENDLGLPDVSLYPILSKMFGISVDELMGVNEKKESVKKKKIIILAPIVIVLIFIILFVVLNNNDDDSKKEEDSNLNMLASKTEEILQITLPDVEKYEYVDSSDLSFVNSWYPDYTYYFIFKESSKLDNFKDSLKNDESWMDNVSRSIVDILPTNAKPYEKTCEYFKLISDDGLIINSVPIDDGIYYLNLYCYQDNLNRLIVISFKYEVKSEKNL